MSHEALVVLERVCVGVESGSPRAVLRDVSWEIGPGEWWVVSGEAASGKSALLAAASGLVPPIEGTLRLLGVDVARATESERIASRRAVGFVFEGAGRLLGKLPVWQNVTLGAAYHENLDADSARSRALALLALAGLESLADATPASLPVSVQRRLALLRALAAPLRLLFLDDPLRGLSEREASWWLDFVARERERRLAEGTPFAIVSTGLDAGAFASGADRFASLSEGRFDSRPAQELA